MLEWFSQAEHWLMFAAIVAVIYFISGGLTFINCLKPIRGYIDIFRDSNGKLHVRHLLFFFGLPMLFATATNLHGMVDSEILNVIGVIAAILTATLYSFLSSIDAKHNEVSQQELPYLEFRQFSIVYKETVDLISMEIVISVLMMILCFVEPIMKSSDYVFVETLYWIISVRSMISWMIYFLLYGFILNLLMATKRFYTMVRTHES